MTIRCVKILKYFIERDGIGTVSFPHPKLKLICTLQLKIIIILKILRIGSQILAK